MSENEKEIKLLTTDSKIIKDLVEGVKTVEQLLQEYIQMQRPTIYIPKEVICERISISERTLANYRKKGYITYTQIEGTIRYKEADVEAMMEKFKVPARKNIGD